LHGRMPRTTDTAPPTLDVARLRAETPGCAVVTHLNAAGAALPAAPVVDATIEHLRLEARLGGYEAAERNAERVQRPYAAAAQLLGCGPDEIAVVENATRAWDMVFYSLRFGAGDRILTSQAEYASNYIAYLQVRARTGVEIVVVPDDEHGQLSVDALSGLLDERVKLISVTHVPTNGGLVNPAAEIGAVARAAGVPFLLDACQSVGQLPVDVRAIGCDFLSATGRKYLRAPRGTGLLYVRRERLAELEPPFLDLHAARWGARDTYTIRDDARRFENWETNYAGKVGLGVALDYALALGDAAIWSRIRALGDELRGRLGEIPGVTLRDLGAVKGGIVSFTYDGRDPRRLMRELRAHDVNIWFSGAESTRLDMEARDLDTVVRASVHYYNDSDELDRFCTLLAGVPAA
jgi:cysteine desulfurase / selenocysteine lyase